MKKIEHPKPGQIWEYGKLQREIIEVSPNANRHCNDFNVIWKRPKGKKEEFIIWLPYWRAWANKAHLVS